MKYLLLLFLLFLAPSTVHADSSHTLRGFDANDPGTQSQFSPEWTINAYGLYLNSYNFGATKIAIGLFEQYSPFTTTNIQSIESHLNPNNDIWYILLREPDLNQTPQVAANEANAQMSLVLSVDPNAKFCLSVGTGINPPYRDNSYGDQLWSLITDKADIDALCITYYPYQPEPQFRKFLKQFKLWHPNREHWITEHGIAKGLAPNVAITPGLPFTMTNARNEMDADGIDRSAWYPEFEYATGANYFGLEDSNFNVTATGIEFQLP